MPRFFHLSEDIKRKIVSSNAQLFITGGRGGVVTYDGEAGALQKKGGPLDRLFLLFNDGRLLGDAGLDLEGASIDFRTGALIDPVTVSDKVAPPNTVHYRFRPNASKNGFVIRGGMPNLGLDPGSILVSGDVNKSEMICERDVKLGQVWMPYSAFHTHVSIHHALLDYFNIASADVLGGETSWSKLAPPDVDMLSNRTTGVGFRTRQHLGHVRVFLSTCRG